MAAASFGTLLRPGVDPADGSEAIPRGRSRLDLDLLRHPELVVAHHSEVTAWFWNAKHLHAFSDSGDVEACTRAMAGGGATPERLADARVMYDRACAVLVGARQLAA